MRSRQDGAWRVEIPDVFSPGLRRWLQGRVVYDEAVPFGGAVTYLLEDGAYAIAVGPKYRAGNTATRRWILMHELGHVVRGDCLTLARDRDLVPMLWNLAADALINQGMPEHHGVARGYGAILYEDLPEELGLPAKDRLPGARVVYDALKRQADKAPPQRVCGGAQPPSAGGQEQAGAHGAEVLELRDAMTPEERREVQGNMGVGGVGRGGGSGRGRGEVPAPDPRPLAEDILRAVRGVLGGGRVRRRTWRRRHRAVPGLPSVLPEPTVKALVAVDVSGSVVGEPGRRDPVLGAAAWLLRRYPESVGVLFDTEVRGWRPGQAIEGGGGTLFGPVWARARAERADLVVMVTDGEPGDAAEGPGCPVVWVLPQGFRAPWRRPKDREVFIP